MPGTILVINAGSSSIKFALFDGGTARSLAPGASGQVEGIGTAPRLTVRVDGTVLVDRSCPGAGTHDGALDEIRRWLGDHLPDGAVHAVGHRIVHGGETFASPVRINGDVLKALERLIPLAPLHQPHNLAVVSAVAKSMPEVPQVACFDTAFHRTQPALAQACALPASITAGGVRRYGFHGLSYEYIAAALPRVAPALAGGRVVVAHLGNGASMCAMHAGRSIATTMGFTALDGLVMGTRCGSLDPGVLLYLMDQRGMDARALERLLYHEAGLLGVSGLSSDMRTLLASDDARAQAAVDLFVYRVGRELGSLAAALGGLDALVFTGGIGENAASVRARVCAGAAWLGIRLDAGANGGGGPRISSAGTQPSAWVIPTDENLMIARHTQALLTRKSHRFE